MRFTLATLLFVVLLVAAVTAHFADVHDREVQLLRHHADQHHALFRRMASRRLLWASEGDELRFAERFLKVRLVRLNGNKVTVEYKYGVPRNHDALPWKKRTDTLTNENDGRFYGEIYLSTGMRSCVAVTVGDTAEGQIEYSPITRHHY